MTTDLLLLRGMRAEVADSWQRSAAAGVVPDRVEAPVTVGEGDLAAVREAHPLARVFPLLDDVLGQAVRECEAVMAIGDADGQYLRRTPGQDLLPVAGGEGARAEVRKLPKLGKPEGSAVGIDV